MVGLEKTKKIEITNPSEGLKFESLNPEVATVDDSGNITGVKKWYTGINITDKSGNM